MNYVYLLENVLNNKEHYLGSTSDLKRRLKEHNNGTGCETTKNKQWKLIYYEAYETLQLARNRELKLKKHRGSKRALYQRLDIS